MEPRCPDGTMFVSDSDEQPSNCGTHKVKVNLFKLNSTMVFLFFCFFWNLFYLPEKKNFGEENTMKSNEPAGGGGMFD